jgi:Ni,Fe-hydrogenase III large subunit
VKFGARPGTPSLLRRLVAAATSHDLRALIVPGTDVARAHGLDLSDAGLRIVASPRHANLLLLIEPVPSGLAAAAAVLYAQMLRPRAILRLGGPNDGACPPLPSADIQTGLSQQGLIDGVTRLRATLAREAFRPDTSAFDAPGLTAHIVYTCPMHPEVIQDEPGSCPKCGMTLVEQGSSEPVSGHDHSMAGMAGMAGMEHEGHAQTGVSYSCPMHPEVVQNEPGSCPKCGMTLVAQDDNHIEHDRPMPVMEHEGHTQAQPTYSCPMHPEVIQDEPGACPKCGMTLVAQDDDHPPEHGHAKMDHKQMDHGQMDHSQMDHSQMDHSQMDHSQMDHSQMGFMSMVGVTKDLPRSPDGLPMDWIKVPFGPFFPGLPGGLLLSLTLDGDTVADTDAGSLVGRNAALPVADMEAAEFVDYIGSLDPLAPMAYRLLACRALEDAVGGSPAQGDPQYQNSHIAAVERERISSHLGWLAQLGEQSGFTWLTQRAGHLQRQCLNANAAAIGKLRPALAALTRRLTRTPLLATRLSGVGRLSAGSELRGPVARATGMASDARGADPGYAALSFTPSRHQGGDAYGRLRVRLAEILQSLDLIQAAGDPQSPQAPDLASISGDGMATIETPRGEARLQLTLAHGRLVHAELDSASGHHLRLLPDLLAQLELGDALSTVNSLDLSPWELQA